MTNQLFQDISQIDTSDKTVNKALHHEQIKEKLKQIFRIESEKGYSEGYKKGYSEGNEAGLATAQTETEIKHQELENIKKSYNKLMAEPCGVFTEATEESIVIAFGHILEALAPTLIKEDNTEWKANILGC